MRYLLAATIVLTLAVSAHAQTSFNPPYSQITAQALALGPAINQTRIIAIDCRIVSGGGGTVGCGQMTIRDENLAGWNFVRHVDMILPFNLQHAYYQFVVNGPTAYMAYIAPQGHWVGWLLVRQ